MVQFRQLDAAAIDQTIVTLERRIAERFPDSHLRKVAAELVRISQESAARIEAIQRPITWMRICVWSLLALIFLLLIIMPFFFHQWGDVKSILDFIQILDPSLNTAFFIGAFVVYLLSIERSIKRNRALAAIHELRSMAHVVDMHQLTKDPVMLTSEQHRTASSPTRTMTDFELSRYFDYCSEMVSLISKVAALYIQDFQDPVAISAVDEVESLSTGLSEKMWQKISLLNNSIAINAIQNQGRD